MTPVDTDELPSGTSFGFSRAEADARYAAELLEEFHGPVVIVSVCVIQPSESEGFAHKTVNGEPIALEDFKDALDLRSNGGRVDKLNKGTVHLIAGLSAAIDATRDVST